MYNNGRRQNLNTNAPQETDKEPVTQKLGSESEVRVKRPIYSHPANWVITHMLQICPQLQQSLANNSRKTQNLYLHLLCFAPTAQNELVDRRTS
jgi:hypothetical protein